MLSSAAASAISAIDAVAYVSVASAWEIAIKVGAGKWEGARGLLETFSDQLAAESFLLLPISIGHVRTAGLISSLHRDPFDRLLAAQAQIEGLTLVTADPKLTSLGAPVLW